MFGQSHFSKQTTLSIFKEEIKKSSSIEMKDIQGLEIASEHISAQSNIQHSYIIQRINGYQINGRVSSIHLYKNQDVLKLNNQFLSNKQVRVKTAAANLSAVQAIRSAAQLLNYSQIGTFKVIDQPVGTERKQLISKGLISNTDIPAKLVYHVGNNNELKLAWDISIQEKSGENWWSLRIDAQTGEILDKTNWIISCNFGDHPKTKHNCASHHPTKTINDNWLNTNNPNTLSGIGGYRVFELPLKHPDDGSRTFAIDPDDAVASPYGWHDTNGVPGPEYTITRGNNVHAFDEGNNPNYSPDGGSILNFDFPLDLTMHHDSSEAAAITNLFYTSNIAHDVLVHYGFDEASGNFQETNYSGQGLGQDFVLVKAQIEEKCNATFGTPPDGQNPTMSNYYCNGRDGAYTNVVILHEYAHGLSNRLTGGGALANCLNNSEQMGEGWSDYLSIILTLEAGDNGADSLPIGTWLFNDPTGIRPHPYSTDMAINPYTYKDIPFGLFPHGFGSIWCNMLWEMTWGLIAQHGFDPDIYTGTGGNNIALQLVVEGMKLQPCSPGFVDGRDAILAADQALYGGANQCIIWQAFAKRGLGTCADQGLSTDRYDGIEDYDVPFTCGGLGCEISFLGPAEYNIPYTMGDDFTFDILVEDNAPWFVYTNVPWINFDSTSGSGNATISFDYDANPTYVRRSAFIEINCGGAVCSIQIDIDQDARPCDQSYGTIPYSTGFESGLDFNWCTYSSLLDGRIMVWPAYQPNTGNNHLTLAVVGTNPNLNQATLGLDLSGQTNDVNLVFWWKEFNDEDHPQDGVFFSNDGGANYVKFYDLTGGPATYQKVTLNISTLAANNGLALTDSSIIKFQQYGNQFIPNDGFAFDDIEVIASNCTIGAPCDDQDTCTVNDVYNAICICAGTFLDSDNDGVCDNNDICPGGDDNIDFDDDNIPDDCDYAACNECGVVINSYPHIVDFETNPLPSEICRYFGADFVWNPKLGSTGTSNTGPTSAYQGSFYYYTESNFNNNETAAFQGGCYDLSSPGTAEINFRHHMYGQNMGSIALEISIDTGQTWSTVWTRSGNQGNAWIYRSVDLSNYTGSGNILTYRFIATIGNGDRSDMALDMVRVEYTPNVPSLTFNLKALLEGPYSSFLGEMSNKLYQFELLPGMIFTNPGPGIETPPGQPYTIPPWNYQGTEGQTYSNGDYDPTSVDWVLMSLRTGIDATTEIHQAAGILKQDGIIEFLPGTDYLGNHPGPYYVLIEHRNHMGALSAQAITPQNGVLTYDFTTQNSWRPNGGFGQKQISPGLWALYAGDGDQVADVVSYDINGVDRIFWSLDNGIFIQYRGSDFNLSGEVSGADKILWDVNTGIYSGVPK